MNRKMTAKSTSRFAFIMAELARLDAIYAECRTDYGVRIVGNVDYYAAYSDLDRDLHFNAKFLDGHRAKSDAHLLDSIRHEYAHMIVSQNCWEPEEHGPRWAEIAAFLGAETRSHLAYA